MHIGFESHTCNMDQPHFQLYPPNILIFFRNYYFILPLNKCIELFILYIDNYFTRFYFNKKLKLTFSENPVIMKNFNGKEIW